MEINLLIIGVFLVLGVVAISVCSSQNETAQYINDTKYDFQPINT